MLNFFKPISGGTAKRASDKILQAAVPPQKKARAVTQEPVDLVSSEEQPAKKVKKPLHAAKGVTAVSNGDSKQSNSSHKCSTLHRQQDGKLVTAGPDSMQDAAPSSSLPAMVQTAQEDQLNRSNINPSVGPVRRFKGVPYTPDAGSIEFLTNMGFSHDHAVRALKITQGNIERAANWLISQV